MKLTIEKILDTDDIESVETAEIRGSFRLDHESGAFLVAELWLDPRVGETEYLPGETEWVAKISELYVPRGMRRKGIARAIITEAVRVIRDEWDEDVVFVQAIPSHDHEVSRDDLISFYEDMGLKVVD